MAKMNEGRRIYNVEEMENKKTVENVKGAKTKPKLDKGVEFGSGRGTGKTNYYCHIQSN